MSCPTEINVNTTQELVTVELGDCNTEALISIDETPQIVECELSTTETNVEIATNETSPDVDIILDGTQPEEVLINVYDGCQLNIFKAPVGEYIEPFRIVYIENDGRIYKNQITDQVHVKTAIGMTLENGVLGTSPFLLTYGQVQFAGWSWDTSLPLFLALDGQITQSPGNNDPSWLQIGKALAQDLILLDIQEATINGN